MADGGTVRRIVVSAVALLIVGPIKGRPFAAGWNMRIWLTLFVLHAAFGLGTALLLRGLKAGEGRSQIK